LTSRNPVLAEAVDRERANILSRWSVLRVVGVGGWLATALVAGYGASRPTWRAMVERTRPRASLTSRSASGTRSEARLRPYQAVNGHYPDQLSDLVPVLLPSVPREKYVLGFGRFEYHVAQGRHTLGYTALPPFGRPFYVFEERRWGYLD
jgi:hypothetical protein